MKRIIPSIAILLLTGYTLTAQKVSYGFRAAANFSKVTNAAFWAEQEHSVISNEFPTVIEASKSQILPGFHGGAFFNIELSSQFSIQPEANFNMYGSKTYLKWPGTGNETTEEQRLNYFSVPVLLQYRLSKDFFLEAGFQLDFLLSAKRSYRSTNSSHETFTGETTNTDSYKKQGFDINFGAGYQIPKLPVGVFFRYNLGVTNLPTMTWDKKLENRTAQLGVFFKVPNKK
ncbi:porin family protein [Pinibacter soli]|uniref:Porin family protein n=1 Tax=Pinibacter soli TaxID=3044211 RepID=A0ABT6RJ49_9BACT|nr:porin family protein [Pinibacter soli]MDI3322600.1 porin family protein [Pinibacter soli]